MYCYDLYNTACVFLQCPNVQQYELLNLKTPIFRLIILLPRVNGAAFRRKLSPASLRFSVVHHLCVSETLKN
jgi:hypothetical protein